MIGFSLLDSPRLWRSQRPAHVDRQSVDVSAYPDLVMIMLGFQLRGWRGLLALRRIGRGLGQIARRE